MRHTTSPSRAAFSGSLRLAARLACGLLLFGLLLSGSAVPGAAEDDPAGVTRAVIGDRKVPGTLREIRRRLEKLVADMDAVRKEAKRDPDDGKITIYENYTPDDFKDRKRKVHAEDLVRFMADPKKDMKVRAHAYRALKDGPLHGDPDLSREKRGSMLKRGYFANKHLVNLLRDEENEATRDFTNRLLNAWWMVRSVKPILDYDVRKPKSWKPAYDAWKREFKKKR